MQIQKTRSVIARQLSQRDLYYYFFPRSYPAWAWGLAAIGLILICIGPISQLWLVSGVGLLPLLGGSLYLFYIKRGNPDDSLYDAWVENQGQLLAQKGFHVLDITRSQMSDRLLNMRSYVLPGSIDAADYNPKAVQMKYGKDGELRFSINVYTYIYPLKNGLAIFKGDINALDPRSHNDRDDIYSYRILEGVCMTSNSRDKILLGEQRYPYHIEKFGLRLNYGEPITFSAAVKVKAPGSMSGIVPTITLPDTGFNRTYNILRKLLLSQQWKDR